MFRTPHRQQGFSLVELSVVIVIIALLAGGIIAGQSLIKNAKLRSVSTTAKAYLDAVATFNDKYGYLPGDFPAATDIWGTAASCDNGASSVVTCNGNGNGKIAENVSGREFEMYRAWQHLANAKMVDGKYTGGGSGGTVYLTRIKTNVPAGQITGSGYTLLHNESVGSLVFNDTSYLGHMLVFGKDRYSTLTGPADTPALSSPDAYLIDSKIDDGAPGTGSLISYRNTLNPNCVNSDVSATATYYRQSTGTSDPNSACTLVFVAPF